MIFLKMVECYTQKLPYFKDSWLGNSGQKTFMKVLALNDVSTQSHVVVVVVVVVEASA